MTNVQLEDGALSTMGLLEDTAASWARHFDNMPRNRTDLILRLYQYQTTSAPSRSDAYRLLGVDPNTGRRYMKRMQDEGWVSFSRDQADRRKECVLPPTKLFIAFNAYAYETQGIISTFRARPYKLKDPPD